MYTWTVSFLISCHAKMGACSLQIASLLHFGILFNLSTTQCYQQPRHIMRHGRGECSGDLNQCLTLWLRSPTESLVCPFAGVSLNGALFNVDPGKPRLRTAHLRRVTKGR